MKKFINRMVRWKPEIFRIYKEYAKRCFQAGAMDFDDLLYQTNVLLRDFPAVLHFYQQKFKYVLVDEYQDTNYSQYLIVKKLAAVYENICVVGDDAQSIYSFRGANIENILNFKKDYPDFKIFKLEQNYRSTSNIVNAANSIIKRNKDQIQKNVWTSNAEGGKINIIRCLTDNEEGRVITNRIFDIKQRERGEMHADTDFGQGLDCKPSGNPEQDPHGCSSQTGWQSADGSRADQPRYGASALRSGGGYRQPLCGSFVCYTVGPPCGGFYGQCRRGMSGQWRPGCCHGVCGPPAQQPAESLCVGRDQTGIFDGSGGCGG